MSVIKSKLFKFIFCPAVFIFSLGLQIYSHKMLSSLALLAVAILYFHFLWIQKTTWLKVAWIIFVVSAFLPIDISFKNYPGPPRFVPLVMGLPDEREIERAERGEIMLGGCILNGNEPKWVWVW